MLLPLVCLLANEIKTVNDGRSPFILTVDNSDFLLFNLYR